MVRRQDSEELGYGHSVQAQNVTVNKFTKISNFSLPDINN